MAGIDKKMTLNTVLQALLTGLGSVIIVQAGYPNYVYLLFAGYTLANCCDHRVSFIPHLIASEAAGWFWALLMYFGSNWVTAVTGSLPLGFFAAIFVGTILLVGFHLAFTMHTIFNCIPVMYLTIFSWFSVTDVSKIPHIAAIITLGMVLSTLYEPICDRMFQEKE